MKKNILFSVICSVALSLGFTSCEDMLEPEFTDRLDTNANDTLYSYLGILTTMQDVAERQVILGELRGDLVSANDKNITDTLAAIANFENPKDGSCSMLNISDYYNIINNCNFYLKNADTLKVKSNKRVMLPEYVQVIAIRAWTYLQLVKNYNEVPYFTEPLKSLSDVKNFDYKNNTVNKNNLVDKMIESGLLKYIGTEYEFDNTPILGNFNNGSVNISSKYFQIPLRIIVGDMYLLRGASKMDYQKAAQYYYGYLNKEQAYTQSAYVEVQEVKRKDVDELYNYTSLNWGMWGRRYEYSNPSQSDLIFGIPSAANAHFGKVLTRAAEVYGFIPRSSVLSETTTEKDENGKDKEVTNMSGAITVSPTAKAQIRPSDAYYTLNKNQTYLDYDLTTNRPICKEFESGDARYQMATTTYIDENGDNFPLCTKASKGNTFYYMIPMYRATLVWLRFAEAINRLGFPQMAFAILKDGINDNNMPKYTETGVKLNSYLAMNYVDSVEVSEFNKLFDFSNNIWEYNYGIHARGCGYGSWPELANRSIVTNITGANDSTYFDYVPMLVKKGLTNYKEHPEQYDSLTIINAVEDIIVDELGLETAFEGNRFTDLIRIADHKTNAGLDGTEWLAKKVASRNIRFNQYKDSEPKGNLDSNLYNKLKNRNNWYFSTPKVN